MNIELLSFMMKVIIICFSLIGLYYKSGLSEKGFKKISFIYFTNLNLVFSLIYFVLAIFIYNNKLLNGINGFIILSSIITMTVYLFLLVPKHQKIGENYKLFSLSDIIVHYVVPLLVILNWLIFTTKGNFTYYYPFLWAIPFLIYFFAIVIRAHYGGLLFGKTRYPYYFIDLDKIGVKKAMKNLIIFSSMIIILGYILFFLDLFLNIF
ncbi:MAG: Pr6Pr family membrane protein [Methanobacteriaceae archaeon]|nr:Pr6Pr family membrane protein [Candidatus Methanorudis spinitermitis]